MRWKTFPLFNYLYSQKLSISRFILSREPAISVRRCLHYTASLEPATPRHENDFFSSSHQVIRLTGDAIVFRMAWHIQKRMYTYVRAYRPGRTLAVWLLSVASGRRNVASLPSFVYSNPCMENEFGEAHRIEMLDGHDVTMQKAHLS